MDTTPLTFAQRDELLAELETLALTVPGRRPAQLQSLAKETSSAVIHQVSSRADTCRELATAARRLAEIAEILATDAEQA